ncbi:hypothetical protein EV186_1021133 [Labedaea rhizosphaerae]|uniref:Uncharacterized protein n=1 Tax=Labedaea rhizosphaerae TaxID=598644 RepID=A0A4R6SHI1_LABRH|nr:hypothetical protein EV186_1021133 [Labedaea rhizosphaerae]
MFSYLWHTIMVPPFQAIAAAWGWITWHSITGAILVPLAAVAAGLLLSRYTSKGDSN